MFFTVFVIVGCLFYMILYRISIEQGQVSSPQKVYLSSQNDVGDPGCVSNPYLDA